MKRTFGSTPIPQPLIFLYQGLLVPTQRLKEKADPCCVCCKALRVSPLPGVGKEQMASILLAMAKKKEHAIANSQPPTLWRLPLSGSGAKRAHPETYRYLRTKTCVKAGVPKNDGFPFGAPSKLTLCWGYPQTHNLTFFSDCKRSYWFDRICLSLQHLRNLPDLVEALPSRWRRFARRFGRIRTPWATPAKDSFKGDAFNLLLL